MKKLTISRAATCIKCGKEFQKKNLSKPNKFCSITCRRSKPIIIKPCLHCGNEFQVKYHGNPNKFCGRSCQGKYYLLHVETPAQRTSRYLKVGQATFKRLKGTKSPESSRRMKERNPMFNPEILAKMTATIRAKKTWLGERGGNGFITQPQMLLAEALLLEKFLEYSISMKMARKYFQSLPTHYCVDLAVPELKIAIEVDGHSHKTKKWRFLDKRKTEVLNFLGWVVLRFWNHEVMEDLQGCIAVVKQHMAARLEEIATFGALQPILRTYTMAAPRLPSQEKAVLEPDKPICSPVNLLPATAPVAQKPVQAILEVNAAADFTADLPSPIPFEYFRYHPKPRRIRAMEEAGQLSLF